jgi:methyltransferase (TIGR00027 family)
MQANKPSQTAAWVAGARTLGQLLPVAERLAHDPYGVAFMTGPAAQLTELFLAHPRLYAWLPRSLSLHAFVWWMQLRTRAFDDMLLAFLESGGNQVVLLGAGYDCRAVRFAPRLAGVRFFEVDHPSTQQHKRRVIAAGQLPSRARYVPWDFERQPLSELAARLHAEGLSTAQPVLAFWEGVTMYLSERAIADSLRVVRSLGAAGSWLAFNYIDRRALRAPETDQRIAQRFAASVGEPHRFGWDPAELPTWLDARGYRCVSDRSDLALAQAFLPPEAASAFASANRHIVLTETL